MAPADIEGFDMAKVRAGEYKCPAGYHWATIAEIEAVKEGGELHCNVVDGVALEGNRPIFSGPSSLRSATSSHFLTKPIFFLGLNFANEISKPPDKNLGIKILESL